TAAGTLGLEATYNPIANLRVYSGSSSTVEFGYPSPIFRRINFKVYSGIDVSVWILHKTIEKAWIDYSYPSNASLAMVVGKAADIEEAVGWKVMERPWRDGGAERVMVARAAA